MGLNIAHFTQNRKEHFSAPSMTTFVECALRNHTRDVYRFFRYKKLQKCIKNGASLANVEKRLQNVLKIAGIIEKQTKQNLENLDVQRNKIEKEIADVKHE